MTIKIVPNERGIPQSKLAEAEIIFEEGVLAGLKLIGFGVWEGREGRHVTFPARPFMSNGERRTYSVLRPVSDTGAQEPLRRMILQAFIDYEHQAAALLAAPLEERADADSHEEHRHAGDSHADDSDADASHADDSHVDNTVS